MSTTSDDVSPRWMNRESAPTASSSWARKATTSWRVVASSSSIRRASIRAARRIRSTASLGIRPRRAYTSQTASSTWSQAAYLAAGLHRAPISSRV